MAAALGARLLAGVEEVPLDQILVKVKRLCNAIETQDGVEPEESVDTWKPHPHLQVRGLDRLISVLQPWSKSAEVPVIEVMAAESGGGATHLAYLAIAGAVLPQQPDDVNHGTWKGGKGGLAIILDTDGLFNTERLAQVMASLFSHHQGHHSSDIEATVRKALDQVHLFRPDSLATLVVTLEALPMYLLSLTRSSHPFHASAARALELVIIDSASAFYWQHRDAEEQAHAKEDLQELAYLQNLWQRLVDAVGELQARFGVPLLATAWPAAVGRAVAAAATISKSQLPIMWQQLLTARIHVRRETASPASDDRRQWFHAWAVDDRAVARGTAWHFGIDEAGIQSADGANEAQNTEQ